jgi:multisubunit Na+/H+ antiporter MnhB subunit
MMIAGGLIILAIAFGRRPQKRNVKAAVTVLMS